MICWKCDETIPEEDGMYVQEIESQPTINLCVGCEAAHGWIFSELEYIPPRKPEPVLPKAGRSWYKNK